jgi:hypothetical protein
VGWKADPIRFHRRKKQNHFPPPNHSHPVNYLTEAHRAGGQAPPPLAPALSLRCRAPNPATYGRRRPRAPCLLPMPPERRRSLRPTGTAAPASYRRRRLPGLRLRPDASCGIRLPGHELDEPPSMAQDRGRPSRMRG